MRYLAFLLIVIGTGCGKKQEAYTHNPKAIECFEAIAAAKPGTSMTFTIEPPLKRGANGYLTCVDPVEGKAPLPPEQFYRVEYNHKTWELWCAEYPEMP